ncbi:MAG: tetratricopeptide repeat protein [Alistipes sp.]|nr:tetratricopeptide repeat protein [Alistipes sp.]
MRKTIFFSIAAAVIVCGPTGAQTGIQTGTQTEIAKDPLATARRLYHAGQWAAARAELENALTSDLSASETTESETLAALCAARLEEPGSAARLEALIEKYPASPHSAHLRLRAGAASHSEGDYVRATELLAGMDARRLSAGERDEYNFILGHSYFVRSRESDRARVRLDGKVLDDGSRARQYLERVSRGSDYSPHADYYLAYMEYRDGDTEAARRRFTALASHPSYRILVPYYLLQIALLERDHGYVIENAPALAAQTAPPRDAEIVRMAAQSLWESEDWAGAIENLNKYRALVGSDDASGGGSGSGEADNLGGDGTGSDANDGSNDESGSSFGREENYMMGFALYSLGRLAEAREHGTEAGERAAEAGAAGAGKTEGLTTQADAERAESEAYLVEAARLLALATGPDDALSQNASYHLGDLYLRTGNRLRAMQSFSIASASGHDAAIAEDALFNYGKLLYETGAGRFNEAVNVLTRYVATYPASSRTTEARGYLIAAYYNSHDYAAAYEAILRHPDPDNDVKAALQKITYFRALELWSAGDAEGAMGLLRESLKNRYSAKYTALAAFWQGEILYSGGEYDNAATKLREYLRISPTTETENSLARYDLGYIDFNSGRWVGARDWFDDFVERHSFEDRYRADAFNRLGDIDHAEKAYWRAIENYDRAAAVGVSDHGITPEKHYSAYQRAIMLGLVDRPERKIESLRAIVAKGEGDYVEAATYELGRTLVSRGDYAAGAKVLDEFVAGYPSSTFALAALSNLALARLNTGDGEGAMAYYKAIVERAPWSREARDAMDGIRSIYVDRNDVEGYFDYAATVEVATDTGAAQRDSLSFAAAESVYLAGDPERAVAALEKYLAGVAGGSGAGKAADGASGADAGGGRYVPTATEYLAHSYFKAERYAEAADTYSDLATMASSDADAGRALDGWVAATVATGDADRIKAMEEVVKKRSVPDETRRNALFAIAGVLRQEGRRAFGGGANANRALAIYRDLADEVRTPRGAESTYRVIEYLYAAQDYAAAEEAVFEFSDAGTPHGQWLARAFLVLGDIYAGRDDAFQARATYQSIVDGYSPADDGVIDEAREKIANL